MVNVTIYSIHGSYGIVYIDRWARSSPQVPPALAWSVRPAGWRRINPWCCSSTQPRWRTRSPTWLMSFRFCCGFFLGFSVELLDFLGCSMELFDFWLIFNGIVGFLVDFQWNLWICLVFSV